MLIHDFQWYISRLVPVFQLYAMQQKKIQRGKAKIMTPNTSAAVGEEEKEK